MAGSRSGTATMPRAARVARGRPTVNISLSSEALARLDAIAAERGQTRSGAVEQLVRNARARGEVAEMRASSQGMP
jgi:metal-responsive CopG/Arc/MetJ family transcriptional regulator